LQNILKKVVKKFGRNKERVVSLYQAITLITLKQNIMTIQFTNNMITILKDQLQTTAISRQVSSLIKNEISRLELTLQTV
jgi:hypothetical protein